MTSHLPLLLLILDGWGIAPPSPGNPIPLAAPKTYEHLVHTYPVAQLRASGSAVGLPPKQVGNSEAGHMNLGAGRIVEQDALRINKEIASGLFFRNPAFLEALSFCAKHRSRLHLIGLLTGEESGHAFPSHLTSLLKLARHNGDPPVLLHLFTDGRDTAKFAAVELCEALEKHLGKNQRIATVVGRLWGMDRAKRWSRTERAYDALTQGRGRRMPSAVSAILAAYKRSESDEFLLPTVIGASPAKVREGRVHDDDAVILFNLRSDRARQLTKAFVQEKFEAMNPGAFKRRKVFTALRFVAMTDFGPDLPRVVTAYPSTDLDGTLVHALGDLRQLYIAESEKFAHITFFFNGGHAAAVAGEERIVVPSYDVDSFDTAPEMATPEITRRILRRIAAGTNDVIVANFANADMVAHTGNIAAGIRAVQTIDQALAKLVPAILTKRGTMVITADHGNIEAMVNRKSGEVDTEHNASPVPFIVIGPKNIHFAPRGILADVAPTILRILERTPPKAMTGHSLLRT
ncbi:MAG: 2,3-bisphosphoglycerate-independent phosphoglycerate mutase [bacterium]